ncbi:MAG TPA: redoxin domain-containing protein [Candidatus Binataceae bacterium]|jgi:peroxiredoxin (alkyl hydroperoxide reductase subunit C)|nr:redoxin domain-containing protein [Candidatus Binataceae bacterium]
MLKPGDIAADFDLPAAVGAKTERISLARPAAEMVVLFFYPKDFSFVCPTEVKGFQQHLADFAAEKTRIIGVSCDSVQTHLEWIRELGGIDFPLVADEGGKLASSYDAFDAREGVALRATFILSSKREVLYTVASQANVGRSVAETLRVVRALRSGRMCPADWKPIAETAA